MKNIFKRIFKKILNPIISIYKKIEETLKNRFSFIKDLKKFYRFLLFFILIPISFLISLNSSGLIFLFLVFILIISISNVTENLIHFLFFLFKKTPNFKWLQNIFLVLFSIFASSFVVESYLILLEPGKFTKLISNTETINKYREKFLIDISSKELSTKPININNKFELPEKIKEQISFNKSLVSLPPKWQRNFLKTPNTSWSYSWHGNLYKLDENNFRREIGPFPSKDNKTYRIIAVGDSLTYGEGVAKYWRYTEQLERALKGDFNLEVINIGINGDQSEGIKNTIKKWGPKLKPDLIIYAFVINDFLPQGTGQYQRDLSLPLPKNFKNYFIKRTRTAKVIDQGYAKMLIRFGLGLDFYDDILSDSKNYKLRFRKDVSEMNEFAKNKLGIPPIVVLPTDTWAGLGGRGHSINISAEKIMSEEGLSVISLNPFYEKYNGKGFGISKFEGHPDEEAHSIFASMFYEYIDKNINLKEFKK